MAPAAASNYARDPYPVWLSEIMLQQTRVVAVIAHFHEFLRRLPPIEKLAHSREASVLAALSGLGYYRRARMLHAAAKVVARERGGKFPITAEALRSCLASDVTRRRPSRHRIWRARRSRGRQRQARATAGFGPAAYWRRVLACGREVVGSPASGRFQPGDDGTGGDYVHAADAPSCPLCPVLELCATRGELAGSAKKLARQKKREIHYALDHRDGAVFLVQRPRHARLMAGMWELPEVGRPSGLRAPSNGAGEIAALKALRHPKAISQPKATRPRGTRSESAELCFTLKHSITVTDYAVQVWRMPVPDEDAGKWIPVRGWLGLRLRGWHRRFYGRLISSLARRASSKFCE